MPKNTRLILGSESDIENGNKFLAIFEKLHASYSVSIASCHRNKGEFDEFILSIEEPIIVFLGGMSIAAPGIIRAILIAADKMKKVVFAVPTDIVARSAIEDLPAGTPVMTCGLNTISASHSIINSALSIGHILATFIPDHHAAGYLGIWYDQNKKEKPLIPCVNLVGGLIPAPEKKK